MSKHIVVLGASHAGTSVVQTLEKLTTAKKYAQLKITVVDPRDGFLHNLASPRALVDASVHDKLTLPYTRLFTRAEHIRARAIAISDKSVTLDNGATVDFDYLVVTTGASYPAPAKSLKDSIADIVADVKTVHAAIKAASSVLIVGGGPVGIESAGEIAQDYPDKTVTLVHSHPKFFDGPQWKPKLQTSILAKLEALKVKVILGDRVTVNEADRTAGWTNQTRTLTTDKGVAIASDVQIFAVGNAQFNTGFVASLGENVLNDQGRIKVRNTLQVEGHDNIYAAGDAAGLDSPLAYIAGAQGVLVAKNLVSALDGKKLGTTKPGPAIAFVTMGRKHGSAQLPFGVVGDWMVRSLKGKNMFLNQFQSKAVVKN